MGAERGVCRGSAVRFLAFPFSQLQVVGLKSCAICSALGTSVARLGWQISHATDPNSTVVLAKVVLLACVSFLIPSHSPQT